MLCAPLTKVLATLCFAIVSCEDSPAPLLLTEDLLPPGFPNIDMGPQLKVVERTRTATMLCAASGNPDPEITWYKDFLPIDPSASNGRIKQLRSGRESSRLFSILTLTSRLPSFLFHRVNWVNVNALYNNVAFGICFCFVVVVFLYIFETIYIYIYILH